MWFKKKETKQTKQEEIEKEQKVEVEKKTVKSKSQTKTEKLPKNSAKQEKVEDKKSNSQEKTSKGSYRVIYDMSEKVWLIKKDGAKRVIRKVATKVEATKIAKELSENQNLNLTIHKKDGKFQKKS